MPPRDNAKISQICLSCRHAYDTRQCLVNTILSRYYSGHSRRTVEYISLLCIIASYVVMICTPVFYLRPITAFFSLGSVNGSPHKSSIDIIVSRLPLLASSNNPLIPVNRYSSPIHHGTFISHHCPRDEANPAREAFDVLGSSIEIRHQAIG